MTEPTHEVEVHGVAGDSVTLPLENTGSSPYVWTLELPDGVDETRGADETGPLRVQADRAGSYVLVATLAGPGSSAPMTVLPIRLTVS